MIYDLIVDLIKHLSVSISFLKPYATLFGVIVLLLRQNNIRKVINNQLPKRFRDTQSNDIYDMMKDIKAIKEHLGVKDWENTQQNGQKTIPILSYKRFFLFLQMAVNPKRRVSKMKEYLKKLGRTKFQVYIVFSIVNIYTLIATLSGHTSISTELDPYMPAINIFAQVVGNWVYTHYQGKVDVVTAQNGGVTDVKSTIDGSADK